MTSKDWGGNLMIEDPTKAKSNQITAELSFVF